ncbi:DUF7662 domain-containing protein [Terrabacter sp. RAF57]|uniref:DUF7662 domain-containing protein n=1 Tax=Terrabacter sp. RAF57 TaxID=3233063 RepID=UPI003F9E7CD3
MNRELTGLLATAGEWLGFTVVLEYPVRGGRLDVVWTWTPPVPFPGLELAVPVAGFEIESSWRTRKHVKGDLLNLQDAGVSLGVIVLAGDTQKDEGLRTFTSQLVDRPGANILVWTAEDVRTLARAPMLTGSLAVPVQEPEQPTEDVGPLDVERDTSGSVFPLKQGSALATISHSGKYAALHRWLIARQEDSLSVTFDELEELLGFPLPTSCRHHVAHWHSYEGSAVARAIIDAGWKASRVSLANETLTLARVKG